MKIEYITMHLHIICVFKSNTYNDMGCHAPKPVQQVKKQLVLHQHSANDANFTLKSGYN